MQKRKAVKAKAKGILAWYFAPNDRRLPHGDGREIVLGETHVVDGEIVPCNRGLHASTRLLDALFFSRLGKTTLYRVRLSGTVIQHADKCAASERSYLAGGIDVEQIAKEEFQRLPKKIRMMRSNSFWRSETRKFLAAVGFPDPSRPDAARALCRFTKRIRRACQRAGVGMKRR